MKWYMISKKKCQKITDVILVYFLSKSKALKSYCIVHYFYSLGNNSILLNEHVIMMIRVEIAITGE
jgi:hypothetical protein